MNRFFIAAALIIAAATLTTCRKDRVAVTGVTLDKTTLALVEGQTAKLTATVEPKDASNQKVTWDSDNIAAALVDASGNVAALKAGVTKITVTTESGKKTASCTVTVTAPATAPALSAGTVNRTGDTQAVIGFTTDKAGTAYYRVYDSGAAAPASAQVKAGTSLGAVAAGAVTGKAVTLTAGAKDIYVVVEDAAGNISTPLKIAAAAFGGTDTTPPALSAGTVNRTGDTQATVGFTTDEAGTAYYLVYDSGAAAPTSAQVKAGTSLGAVAAGAVTGKAVTLTAGAKDIYVVVEDAAGNISAPLKIATAAFVPGDTTPPTVISVTPSGTGAPVSGNVAITFSEAMNTTPGTVHLNTTALTGAGAWSAGNTVFTIPYSGLAEGTLYTVNIAGFRDVAGNTMAASNAHSFTTLAAPPFSGSGTTGSPYLIHNAADLNKLRELVNDNDPTYAAADVWYRLEAGFSLSGEWTPIGTNVNPFRGKFDGNKKTISNLTVNADTYRNGLFGVVSGGTVQDLGLTNVDVTGGYYTGGVAGELQAGGVITGCFVSGVKVNGSQHVGGITGQVGAGCELKHCYTTCPVSGSRTNVGGIAGTVSNGGILSNCYATGAISGTDTGGGIAGDNYGKVSFCVALNPNVNRTGTGAGTYFGRVTGNTGAAGSISENVAWNGMTTNSGASFADGTGNGLGVGKIIIETAVAYEQFCPTPPWTRANGRLPGLFGNTVEIPSHIANSLGGLGTPASPWLINNADDLKILRELVNADDPKYNNVNANYRQTANITLPNVAAGSSNWTPIGTVDNRFKGTYDGRGFSIANLIINSSSNYQGLFGSIETSGVVRNIALTGVNINSTSGAIGGIAGHINGRIEFCYVTGSVIGNGSVGGVVGENYMGTVENCYTTCNVTGTGNKTGGIVGYNVAYGSVNKCYATGAIRGISQVGGVVGYNDISSVTNCVALNPSVTATGTGTVELGRVIGRVYEGTISNNYARSMTLTPDPGLISMVHTSKDGATVTSANYGVSTWYTNASYWTTSPVGTWSFTGGASAIWKIGPTAYPLPALNWQSTYPAKPSHL